MGRVLKIVAIICLVLILVVAGIVAYLSTTVDLDQVKQQLSERVEKTTGRELQILGALDLSIFPWLGVEIGETRFGNADGFSGDFASFKRAEARLRLMPLFSKQVEMSTLVLDGFELNLQTRKDGVNNWDDLTQAGSDKAAEPAEKTEEQGAAGALALFLEGIEVSSANISYQDAKAGTSYTLADFHFNATEVGLEKEVPFSLDFKVDLSDPQISGDHQLKGTAYLDPEAGLVKVQDMSYASNLKAKDLPVETIDLDLTANLAFNQKTMRLDVQPFNLKTKVTGEEIPNRSAELSVDSVLALDLNTMAAKLKPLTIGIPGGTIQGEFASAQKGEKQQIDFVLQADQIDVDRFVAPVPPGVAEKPQTGSGTSAGAQQNAGLTKLLVNGDLKIGKLIKDKLLVTDIAMLIKMRDGILDVSPLTAKLYQGMVNNKINVDLRGTDPKIKAQLNVKGFQVGDYLKAAMDKDVIKGAADVNADLSLTAADEATIMRSLNGNAALKVGEGALKGINIPDMIRRAKATLSGQAPPPASDQTTDFTELSGSANIVNGVVSNNDLSMKSPLLRIGGNGQVDLPQEQVNYLVTAKLVASLTGQGGDDLQDLVGVPIPIRVQGSLTDPGWKLDLRSVLEEKVKSQAKEAVEKVLQDPKKALENPKEILKDPKELIKGFKFK